MPRPDHVARVAGWADCRVLIRQIEWNYLLVSLTPRPHCDHEIISANLTSMAEPMAMGPFCAAGAHGRRAMTMTVVDRIGSAGDMPAWRCLKMRGHVPIGRPVPPMVNALA